MKFISRILLIGSFFIFTGCFHIIHFLTLNPDGSLDIEWKMYLSKSLSKKNNKKKQGPSLEEKIAEAKTKLTKILEGNATNMVVNHINTQHQNGISISLTLKKPIKIDDQKSFPVVPWHNVKNNTLEFSFPSDKKKGPGGLGILPGTKKKPVKSQEKKNSKDSNSKSKPDHPKKNAADGMSELVQAILSTARYQIFLSPSFKPVSVTIKGKASHKILDQIPISNFSGMSMIDFPFMSYHIQEPQGYDLIIQLK